MGSPTPNSDLNLWQVTETFPTLAPLHTQSDEVGKPTVVIGRGTQRGSDASVNGLLAGWNWAEGDGVHVGARTSLARSPALARTTISFTVSSIRMASPRK